MWTIEQTGPALRFVVKDVATGEPIASTYGQDGQEAHALQMAAAPAMLAALQGMVRGYREAFGDAIESDGREGGAFSEYFAAEAHPGA